VDPLSALIFLVLLLLSGLFSGTETAITAVSDATLAHLESEGSRPAIVLRKLLSQKGRVIAALLVANNVVNTVLAVFSTVVFDGMLRNSSALPPWAAPIVASITAVTFLLVFGEVLPKSLAVATRTGWSLAAAWPIAVLMFATAPITKVLSAISNFVLRIAGRQSGEADIFDVREIHAMATLSAEAGVIDSLERQLIHRASELNDTRVREIMIPRTDIQALEIGVSVDEIRAFFQKTTFTRIPVYKGDLDDIIGILNFKEFFRHDPGAGRGFEMLNYLHKPLFVSGAMFIGDLLSEMRRQRTHMAVVLDEYGGTSGLITMEDAVEMLVGRIDDEYDVIETPFERIDDTTWEVDGRVTDERLVARMGVVLPREALEGFDTAGGLALKAFGNIPAEGDSTTYHGMEITASRVRGNRVRRVRIRVLPPQEVEEAGQSSRRKATRSTNSVRPAEPVEPKREDDTPSELVHERKDGK
jgi:putative hemolysin